MEHLWYFIGKGAKYVVSFTVTYFLLSISTVVPLYYVGVAIINSFLGKLAKEIIKQPRPVESVKRGYGMPSSHTAALTYFISVVCIVGSHQFESLFPRVLFNLLVVVYGIMACSWRISTRLHSLSQILVGTAFGFTVASVAILYEPFAIPVLEHFFQRVENETQLPILFILKMLIVFIGVLVVFARNIKWFLVSLGKSRDKLIKT
jgi:membrane-associated phospholipid phosphatase